MSIKAAIRALDALAAQVPPDRVDVLAGALALSALAKTTSEPLILDAAAGLESLATGGTLDLDADGRSRAIDMSIVLANYV